MATKKKVKVQRHFRDADSNSKTPLTPVKEYMRRPPRKPKQKK